MRTVKQGARKPVKQEDRLGCAVASTAFVLGVSYQDALRLFKDGERKVKEQANFYCPEIVKILNEKGLNYSWAKLNEKNRQVIDYNLTIVFVEKSHKLPFGHFLARYK
ncbi:MAG TPA: hypothetical protein VFD45_00640, partial [Patescibacteria group bacterium]|nr:hypothetical protein [Patescibacteria group bacterium]